MYFFLKRFFFFFLKLFFQTINKRSFSIILFGVFFVTCSLRSLLVIKIGGSLGTRFSWTHSHFTKSVGELIRLLVGLFVG